MNNLETDEGTKQLVASEASAGAKGGGDENRFLGLKPWPDVFLPVKVSFGN